MSAYERRHKAAMEELKRTEMWPSNYAPPVHHLWRKLGIQVRPPHYLGFARAMISMALFFGVLWGFFMWILLWRGSGMTATSMITNAGLAGTAFGFLMALSYWYGRRKWQLSKWEDL